MHRIIGLCRQIHVRCFGQATGRACVVVLKAAAGSAVLSSAISRFLPEKELGLVQADPRVKRGKACRRFGFAWAAAKAESFAAVELHGRPAFVKIW